MILRTYEGLAQCFGGPEQSMLITVNLLSVGLSAPMKGCGPFKTQVVMNNGQHLLLRIEHQHFAADVKLAWDEYLARRGGQI